MGEVVRKRRLELGLTQEKLCQGICEPITISRLEKGNQTPSRNRINSILERLDLPRDRYFALLNTDEIEIEDLYRRIVVCNVRFEQAKQENRKAIRQEGLNLHRELEGIIKNDDALSRQVLLRSKVILGKEDGPYSNQEEIRILMEAIHLTSPGFELEHIGDGLYTVEEIKIINNLGNVYSRSGESIQAISVFRQLYQYMKEHLKNATPARTHIAMVAFNYARELSVIGRYEEAVQVALEGKKYCLAYGSIRSLAGILSVLAESCHFLGEDEKSKDYYFQTYYLAKSMEDEHNIPAVREEARKYLGLEFET